MPNYLTKEEIRQWRGSLEKITLEEFAARLGKEVEESKPTNDVVDIVMSKGTSTNTSTTNHESFSKIAERAFERERQLSHTPFSVRKREMKVQKEEIVKPEPKKQEVKSVSNKKKETVLDKVEEVATTKRDVQIVLKKSLTDREQMVSEYFLNNVGKTVFAEDLATLLDLPRDYVYKYIKNLRNKIEGDKLKNVPSGGFVLTE